METYKAILRGQRIWYRHGEWVKAESLDRAILALWRLTITLPELVD